jgi:cobalt/nickel transport system permease protein
MFGIPPSPVWAVHLADLPLSPLWLAGGFVLAGLLAVYGAWRIRDEEIPRVAVMASAFFVASLIHVKVPPTSVHLLLSGLVGVVLGPRAALAIPVGLFLQLVLLGQGGYSTLGVNCCIMVLPALLAWQMFSVLRRTPWLRRQWFRGLLVGVSTGVWVLSTVASIGLFVESRRSGGLEAGWSAASALLLHPLVLAGALLLAVLAVWFERRLENDPEFPIGLLVGEVSVLATALLTCVALLGAGEKDWHSLVLLLFVAHLPIAVIEGTVLGFTVGFLARVKPEMLGMASAAAEAASPPEDGTRYPRSMNGRPEPASEKLGCPVDPAP